VTAHVINFRDRSVERLGVLPKSEDQKGCQGQEDFASSWVVGIVFGVRIYIAADPKRLSR
jgi:hypothetical protein